MKRIILVLVLVICCAGYVNADYVNPPGWESNPYFTHQTWEFNTDANPAIPDGGYINPYGPPEPTATFTNGTWLNEYGSDPVRNGLWDFQGPLEGALIDIYIPNEANPNLYKEVWVQLTFLSSIPTWNTMQRMEGGVYFPDKITEGGMVWEEFEELGMIGNLYLGRHTSLWQLIPQPEGEYILLSNNLEIDDRFMLDQVSIDTRCIPEPATMSLLALGGIGLLLRKRKN